MAADVSGHGSVVIGLGVLLIFVAACAMEHLDGRPQQRPSMSRVSLVWNPAGPSEPVGHYALGRIGILRVEGAWNAATANAGDASWRFKANGRSVVVTTDDATGRPIGEYHDRTRVLHWGSRNWDLLRGFGRRPSAYRKRASLSRDGRYALADNGRIVAFLRADGRDWRLNPVNIEVDGAAGAEPGLLLFVAFLTGWLAQRDRNNDGL